MGSQRVEGTGECELEVGKGSEGNGREEKGEVERRGMTRG